MDNFFNQFNSTIYKAEKINTHGGSIRVYIQRGKKIKIENKNNPINNFCCFTLT